MPRSGFVGAVPSWRDGTSRKARPTRSTFGRPEVARWSRDRWRALDRAGRCRDVAGPERRAPSPSPCYRGPVAVEGQNGSDMTSTDPSPPSPVVKGIHFLLYSDDPPADRAFLRDVIGLPSVDAHDGWLIFALPPTELGVHPIEGESDGARTESPWSGSCSAPFLMCDDLDEAMAALADQGAGFVGAVSDDQGVGRFATLRLPGGGTIGLYQPAHATPLAGWATSRPPT